MKQKTLDDYWAKAVKVRDGFKCALCKSTFGIQAHHIFKRRHTTTRFNLDNGITLCRDCHNDAHKEINRDEIISYIGALKYHEQRELVRILFKDYLFEIKTTKLMFRRAKLKELKDYIKIKEGIDG